MITIADMMGEEYRKWENSSKVFISAPTGLGKTYFILNVLLPYACSQNKKILFLVNRKILKKQMDEELSSIPFNIRMYIQVETYQMLERKISEICVEHCGESVKAKGYDALKGYCQYDYVVCDESHYFLSDSNYNTNTELSFRWIQDMFFFKIRIFMSATIDEIKTYIENDDMNREMYWSNYYHIKNRTLSNGRHIIQQVYEYFIPRCYDYVDVHIVENREGIVDRVIENGGKWLIFVDSISYGRELEKILRDEIEKRGEAKSVVMVTSDYRTEKESAEEVDTITNQSKFSSNILISTSVLDNGINIKDLELRNIVLMADTEVEFVQMLGRKRQDGGRTNLYLVKMDKNHFQKRMTDLKKVLEVANKYWRNFSNIVYWAQDRNISKEQLDSMEYREMCIQHCKFMHMLANNELRYEDVTKVFRVECGVLVLSLLSFTHLENLRKIYGDILCRFEEDGEDAFIKEQLSWLGKSDLEARKIIEDSKRSQLDQARETVIDEMRKQLGIQMNSGEAKEFKRKIMKELVTLAKMALCEETEREKAKRSFESKRLIS